MNDTKRARIKELLDEIIRLLEDKPDAPQPANVTTLSQSDKVMTGVVGRPEFADAGGKNRWTAGIGVSNGVGQTEWFSVVAWGEVALAAQEYPRGSLVTLSLRERQQTYVDNEGEVKTKTTYLVNRIATATSVSIVSRV